MAQGPNAIVPPPPRPTGDPATDVQMLLDWLWTFYQATVVESGLLDPAFQANAGTFNANNLPDPSNTSIARSQDTANRAINALLAHGLFP